MRLQNICKGLGLAASALAVAAVSTPALAWEPEKSVEIVVAAGAGGASDQMARMLQAAIQKNNLVKQPIVVTLKGAASGAEALQYMKGAEGDPHKFVIAYSLIYTLPLAAKVPFDWRELTPVSIVAFDEFILWAKADAPYKTSKEFIEAAKASSAPFIFGGTGSKREDQIIVSAMAQKTGAKFSYLPYKSGGEAATQLVGGHTTANVNNPSENSEVWRAGQVKALCVFSDKRIVYTDKVTETLSWNDIPTCTEEGLPITYSMLRGIFLPGKVKDEQAKFYVDLFAKIAETTEYKEYMKKQALAPASLTGKEMIDFLEKDEAMHKQVMTEAGFVASN
jgi:putative tricarboxylic transport membrane protein